MVEPDAIDRVGLRLPPLPQKRDPPAACCGGKLFCVLASEREFFVRELELEEARAAQAETRLAEEVREAALKSKRQQKALDGGRKELESFRSQAQDGKSKLTETTSQLEEATAKVVKLEAELTRNTKLLADTSLALKTSEASLMVTQRDLSQACACVLVPTDTPTPNSSPHRYPLTAARSARATSLRNPPPLRLPSLPRPPHARPRPLQFSPPRCSSWRRG